MKNKKLRIGRIPYANLFPLFYYLDKKCDCSSYRFINGVPSVLNKMLRQGKLDISPSSSVEYLRYKKYYQVLPGLSISSSGPVRSILLFSKFPLNELGGKTIALSSESDTSVVLLKIILREFLSIKCRFKTLIGKSIKKALSSNAAVLLIGDAAMREAKKHPVVSCQLSVVSKKPKTNNYLPTAKSPIYIYDLGEMWYKHTGLPFVFALWIVKKKMLVHKKELIEKISLDLIDAKKYAAKKFPLIARHAPQKKWFGEKNLINYWKCISYDFTDRHMEGLRLFERYAFKK
ncbi:MAG: menaquinone biosynthesis protein [Thermodesulfovibrionia bacterium]